MNVNDFNSYITRNLEGGEVKLPVAQVSEVTACVRQAILERGGPDIYDIIHPLPEDPVPLEDPDETVPRDGDLPA